MPSSSRGRRGTLGSSLNSLSANRDHDSNWLAIAVEVATTEELSSHDAQSTHDFRRLDQLKNMQRLTFEHARPQLRRESGLRSAR